MYCKKKTFWAGKWNSESKLRPQMSLFEGVKHFFCTLLSHNYKFPKQCLSSESAIIGSHSENDLSHWVAKPIYPVIVDFTHILWFLLNFYPSSSFPPSFLLLFHYQRRCRMYIVVGSVSPLLWWLLVLLLPDMRQHTAGLSFVGGLYQSWNAGWIKGLVDFHVFTFCRSSYDF